MHAEFAKLLEMPISVASPNQDTALARCLVSAFDSAAKLLCEAAPRLAARGWQALNTADDFEAKTLRSLAGLIGGSARRTMSVPRFATVRGSRLTPVLDGKFPVGVRVELEVEIDGSGALQAKAEFEEAVPGAAAPLLGRTLWLEWIDPSGGTMPIAAATVGAGWSVTADQFAQVAGASPGAQNLGRFKLSLSSESWAAGPRNCLFAEVQGTQDVVALDLVEEPRIERGTFIVTLGLPIDTRLKFPGHALQLFMPVGTRLQLLGSWGLDEWVEEVRSLRIPVASSAEGKFSCGSALYGRLTGA
jgi:hypothetical protein